MTTRTYQIYGRKSFETPLTQLEDPVVAEGADVKTAVLAKYPDANWIELVAIPVEKMIGVMQKGKKV